MSYVRLIGGVHSFYSHYLLLRNLSALIKTAGFVKIYKISSSPAIGFREHYVNLVHYTYLSILPQGLPFLETFDILTVKFSFFSLYLTVLQKYWRCWNITFSQNFIEHSYWYLGTFYIWRMTLTVDLAIDDFYEEKRYIDITLKL